ncbi:cellulose biosynthesis protein BcsF [Yersinia aleksiciae]|uniref:Membrane protein n=1 Tax=Yersinia aleksiciae TaxID=263819 RepID=A0A0T9UNP1_YERAE|nr:cellulose biosynthesis protein BcsF [Yersinia aleksiciae]AKP33749.1 membrane protein [Yersinia aleksiciae]CFQ46772.1 putative inner membrane protein [Yersinia aleksiciae]CNL56622.1 putative inner membrane protein [Yersinia aleksiciae]
MNLNDIWQILLLGAVIFFPLGYVAHRWFPQWWERKQHLFLSARDLKSAGVWSRDGSISQTKK